MAKNWCGKKLTTEIWQTERNNSWFLKSIFWVSLTIQPLSNIMASKFYYKFHFKYILAVYYKRRTIKHLIYEFLIKYTMVIQIIFYISPRASLVLQISIVVLNLNNWIKICYKFQTIGFIDKVFFKYKIYYISLKFEK